MSPVALKYVATAALKGLSRGKGFPEAVAAYDRHGLPFVDPSQRFVRPDDEPHFDSLAVHAESASTNNEQSRLDDSEHDLLREFSCRVAKAIH